MRVLEISLHNYKVHRNKTIKFEPGVVGIVGENGCGKSSIITALCFLFTGEYDTTRKNQVITLGETEGWVRGKFMLNDKEGTLERHLSGSKVVLTYDGVTYNKFSEVNQLWLDLLQIDATIFNNVIVAKQGEIQSLFSDEGIVREKIFQKIFMVPPTEKIRSIIWENYIKPAVPEKSEEDVVQLQALQCAAATERNRLMNEIDYKVEDLGDSSLLTAISGRLAYLQQCKADLLKRPGIEGKIAEFNTEFKSNAETIKCITKDLESNYSEETLKAKRDKLIAIKPMYERKVSIKSEIDNLTSKVDKDEVILIRENVEKIDNHKSEVHTQIGELSSELKHMTNEKNQLLTLKDKAVCPTCHQSIPNQEKYLQDLMDNEVVVTVLLKEANATHAELSRQSQTMWSTVSKSEGIIQRISYLTEELDKIADVEFSSKELEYTEQMIANYQTMIEAVGEIKNRQVEVSAELRVLDEKLGNLAIYEGHATIEEELPVLTTAIETSKQAQRDITDLQLESAKLEHELLLLDTRIEISELNHKFNTNRKEYLDKLQAVHDIFNVSKFPRKLIETYMSNVQVSLATYLSYFDLPYIVKVEDGFKIRLYVEDQTSPLPDVSGGQQIMIGICLRLALHKMFAKSFPIWIIDEGTNHLSETNRVKYFELINALRKQKVIDQIIVIDHDERLKDVVDQIIEM